MVRTYGFLRGLLDICEEGVMAFEPIFNDQTEISDLQCGYMNSVAEDLLETTADTWVGHSLRSKMEGEQGEAIFRRYLNVWNSGVSMEAERSYVIAGKVYWFRVRTFRIESALVTYFSDITLEKQVEEDKQNFLALKDSLVESSETPMWIKSPDGSYSFVNRAFHELLNLKSWEILGKKDQDLFVPEVADSFLEGDLQALSERKTLRFFQKFPVRGNLKSFITHKYPLYDRKGRALGVGGYSAEIKVDGSLSWPAGS